MFSVSLFKIAGLREESRRVIPIYNDLSNART